MFNKKLTLKNQLYNNWSVSAYECYKRNCVCDGCANKIYCERYGQKELYGMPHLKFTVIQLFKNQGIEGFEAFEERVKENKTPRTFGSVNY